MYIPIFNLLQFSLSSLTRIFDFAPSVDSFHGTFWPRFGILTPYHDRANVPGVHPELPSDCTVNQVMLLHRHGSRGPTGEQYYIQKLVETLANATLPPHLPKNLLFLKDGYQSDLVPEKLTIIGGKQLFDHGVQFASMYPTLTTDVILSTDMDRVVDSAYTFSLGYGKPVEIITFDDIHLPVNWVLPWEECPNFDPESGMKIVNEWVNKYIPPITKRLNNLLPGVGLSNHDVIGALYACTYDLAAHGVSPWCGVFLPNELRGLEYQFDLLMDSVSGHISMYDIGPVVGSVYINQLIGRFTNITGEAEELYLEFGHTLSILVAMAAMNLNKDKEPLSSDQIRSPRKFRTSNQTPFGAWMIWERFSCRQSFDGPQIRLLLNSATYPLTICQQSFKDKKYGTCSLDEFVKANTFSTNIHFKDATWNAFCGEDE